MTTDDLETQATAWIGGQADYWKRRARDAEAERDGLRSYRDDREAEIRATLIAVGEATGLPHPATLADAPGAARSALFEQRQRAEQAEEAAAEWQAACEAHQADGEALMAAIERVRALHAEEYGSCRECTDVHSVLWPCPTIQALDAPQTPAEPRTGVPRHTDATREAGEAQEAAE